MLEKLMGLALNNRLLVVILAIAIVGLGSLAFHTLPIDAFPDVTNVQVEIVCNAPGLSPLEIEKFVTYPIEMAMRGLPGLVDMRSITKYGLSVVTLVFQDAVDIYFARQLVFERLTGVQESLPAGVDCEMGPVATAMGEIYQYTLEGPEPADPAEKVGYFTELRTLQDWVIAPILKGIPGVNEINSFGGYIQQFQVTLHPEKLLNYRLSVQEVFEAIERNNQNAGGNIIETPTEQYVIRGIGLLQNLADIGQVVLKSQDGVPVYIRDVAQVESSHALRQGLALKDGKGEAVGGVVMLLKGENSRTVVERVKAKVAEINASTVLPKGIQIKSFYDRSEIVGKSIHTVVKTLAEGAILVVVVFYLILRSVRGAIIVLLTLPLSMLLTFLVMKQTDLHANLMSLGGLAISIGMIIDAAIIQVENVQRHLSHMPDQSQKLAVVFRAVVEVRKPSIFGELIIALTFLPIITLQGMEGKMFAPLAYTVAIAIFASLFLSIFVVPVLCSFFLKSGPEKESLLMRMIRWLYLPLLRWSLHWRNAVIAVSAIVLALAAASIPYLGKEFIPIMDEGAFDMDIQLPPGTSLPRSALIAEMVQKRLMQFEELETIVGKTGQTGIAIEARGVEKTGFVGSLKPRSQWKNAATRDELYEKMREAIEDIPGIAYGFSQPIQCRIDELVAGTRAQIIVKLFGTDAEILKQKSGEIAAVLTGIRGTADLVTEVTAGQPYVSIRMERSKMARYGLNVSDVLNVIEIVLGGKPAARMYQEDRIFDLVLKYPDSTRRSAQSLGEILVDTGQGFRLPLSQLADIRLEEGPVQISRENARRRTAIEVNIQGRDLGGYVADAQKQIRENVTLPSGYYIEWGGQFQNQIQAMRRLSIITPVVIGAILLLLFITFQSLRLAILVLLTLPFALVGGIATLHLTGMYLSVPASVGFIVLFGVAVLNGVVLITYILQLRQRGMSPREAVLAACQARIRPILMTASTTIFGLIPMILATGPGSEVQKPLAMVVVGGLVTSTLATLLVLPAIYTRFEHKHHRTDMVTNPMTPEQTMLPESGV